MPDTSTDRSTQRFIAIYFLVHGNTSQQLNMRALVSEIRSLDEENFGQYSLLHSPHSTVVATAYTLTQRNLILTGRQDGRCRHQQEYHVQCHPRVLHSQPSCVPACLPELQLRFAVAAQEAVELPKHPATQPCEALSIDMPCMCGRADAGRTSPSSFKLQGWLDTRTVGQLALYPSMILILRRIMRAIGYREQTREVEISPPAVYSPRSRRQSIAVVVERDAV